MGNDRQATYNFHVMAVLAKFITSFVHLFFCLFICQDRTRSTLLGTLAKDLLEKNALILDAAEEEVRC